MTTAQEKLEKEYGQLFDRDKRKLNIGDPILHSRKSDGSHWLENHTIERWTKSFVFFTNESKLKRQHDGSVDAMYVNDQLIKNRKDFPENYV